MSTRSVKILLLLAGLCAAQETPKAPIDAAAESIKAAALEKHLKHLASDDLEGRNTGYPGNDKASEYIAEHFRKIGLAPVGDKDDGGKPTYWQHFKVGKRTTRNCVGWVEGTDEKLKAELVVIGAHHDHVGKSGQSDAGRMRSATEDPDDKIWNGADDNGSGTVTVLEIARAFMEGKVRTKRSVLFMTFSGEEYGLLGSIHYCEHPIFPLAGTVAMINLDMVGRNPEKRMEVGGVGTSADWEGLLKAAAEGTGVRYLTTREVSQGSDHFSFAQKRVPAVHFFTGFHGDYHCQSDHPDRIAYANMEKIGRFGVRLLAGIAEAPERPKPSFKAQPKKLGIMGEDLRAREAEEAGLGEEEGGIRLTTISAGSPAEAAGFRAGDLLVEFDGKRLPRDGAMTELRELIAGAKAGVDIPVVVLRDGKRTKLKVRWEEK